MGRKRLTKGKIKWIERTVETDRSYKAIVYNRAIASILLLLINLALTVALLMVSDFVWAWHWVAAALAVLAVLYLTGREQRRPTRTLWIILLLTVPLVGLSLYLLYGDGKTNVRMMGKLKRARKKLTDAQPAIQEREQGEMETLLSSYGYNAYTDGDVTFYPTGKELFAAMKEALQGAKEYILMEFFILSGGKMWKELLTILLRKAEEGVKIKLIYDDFGSIFSLPPRYANYLESLHPNIECLAFNKVYPIFSASYNHRDHRKILVVDGRAAFTGGVNIADEYIDEKKRFGYWKDTGVRICGGGALGLARIFLEMWIAFKDPELDPAPYLSGKIAQKTGEIAIPFADDPLSDARVSESVFLQMISSAKERLYITTPYLVLDETLRAALCLAAMRGVDVRIITPGIPDKKLVYRLTRANYDALLKAGVRIYEYTPGFLHAKQTLSDGSAAVGTTNYDYRSLYLHFENMLYFQGGGAVQEVERDFQELFLISKERTLADTKRNFFGRAFDTLLRIFEPLL